jgi:hypothetical protein
MGFHRGPQIVRNGLVLYLDAANKKSYPGAGSVWKDLSGLGNDATIYGSPTKNKGIQFRPDAVERQYVLASSNEIMKGNDSVWTLEALFKLDGDPSTGEAFILGKAGCHAGIMSYSGYRVYNTITTTDCFTGAGAYLVKTLSNGQWCSSTLMHVGNGLIKRFINGIFVSSVQIDLSNYTLRTHSDTIYIGGYNHDSFRSNSEIQLIKCYNRPLTDNEVNKNFQAIKSRVNL